MPDFGNYDAWKLASPYDTNACDAEICDQCGGFLERDWPRGDWHCDRCDDEREYRERQLDEQFAQNEGIIA